VSGCPIIQNGKLIGAVTHVLVNDPTTGYGIFIENMLDTAHKRKAGGLSLLLGCSAWYHNETAAIKGKTRSIHCEVTQKVSQTFLPQIVQADKRACCLCSAGGKPFDLALMRLLL